MIECSRVKQSPVDLWKCKYTVKIDCDFNCFLSFLQITFRAISTALLEI